MDPLCVGARASSANPTLTSDCSRLTFLKPLLLMIALACGGLTASPADAYLVTTTGTITSGSETGGLFGLPTATTSLAGDSYTLIVNYAGLGPNYFTTPDGSFAQDVENSPGITGSVTAIVNGQSLTTPIALSLGSSVIEDNFDFAASNQGFDRPASTGAFVNVLQDLSCTTACIPFASLTVPVRRFVLGAFDFGTDLYTFQGAGFPARGTPTANFTGTETSFAVSAAAVPEPASWLLLSAGLFALGTTVVRRRSA